MARENYSFSQVPSANIPRSRFDRSHGHKTTFDSGYLIPLFVDEVLPGDTFDLRASLFARLATPIYPVMDNLYLDTFWFFVPNRLLWENWQRFCGEQSAPGDSVDYLVPQVDWGEGQLGSGELGDYFGLPIGVGGLRANAFHFRAYNLIYNEWFRDENLQSPETVPVDDGPDDPGLYSLLRRGKRKDYFTACMPWPQKGPGVNLPLGTSAPVIMDPESGFPTLEYPTSNLEVGLRVLANEDIVRVSASNPGISQPIRWADSAQDSTGLIADLSDATAATINSLREAFQIQRLLERDARGGTRYVELLRAHFGVVSPDFRLQRPEYLGGGSIPVHINPVMQTSASVEGETPQGTLAAYGVVAGKSGFSKSFVEHGVLLGLACVRADMTYQEGLHKMWTRQTRYDYYWPVFANLGEQAVLNKELVCSGTEVDDQVFGYQERWAEYRYFPSKITGLLRSRLANGLDSWHLAQDFNGTVPLLGASFIRENPPVGRIVAVPSEPEFILDSFFKVACTRPMPTFSVPGLIDHF